MNLQKLYEYMAENGLLEKSFRQMDKPEVLALCEFIKGKDERPPYINDAGEIVIPANAPKRFRWWAGGQSVIETLKEIDAPADVFKKYEPWEGFASDRFKLQK